MRYLLIASTTSALLMLGFLGCADYTKTPEDGVRFYRSFASYELPLRPVDEITKEEASQLGAYLEAHYQSGKLIMVLRHWPELPHWPGGVRKTDYYYRNDGTIERTVTAVKGDNIYRVRLYDEQGGYLGMRDFESNGQLIDASGDNEVTDK